MKIYDTIVIGSGLGGLITAAILAKEGQSVLVLEKGKKTGGLLHTFSREKKYVFNTGMNYIGSLEENGFLYQYLHYLGVMEDLKLQRLDMNAFEEISFADSSEVYHYAQGAENFINTLSQNFSSQTEEIRKYIQGLWKFTEGFPLLHLDKYESIVKSDDYLKGSASDYIAAATSNSKLQAVLAATNSLYGGEKDKTPLYVHALVNRQFIESAWRFIGGSQQLANALMNKVKSAGGEVFNNSEVVKIDTQNSEVSRVDTMNDEAYFAKNVVSNIHPAQTLAMLEDSRIKTVTRRRISRLENSQSFFNVYIIFKPNSFPYINRNIYHFPHNRVWKSKDVSRTWPFYYMFYTAASKTNQEWAENASLMTYMDYSEVAKWKGSNEGMRGDDYEAFKQHKAELLIDELSKKYPNIRSRIQSYFTATPLTYEHYTAAPQGAAYGIAKDHNKIYQSIIMPKTKVPNLFYTGQNLNMHGALGVTISAALTSSEIIGMDYLVNKIRKTL